MGDPLKQLTVNEVIKALECCSNTVAEYCCEECHLHEYEGTSTCITKLCKDSSELIKHLQEQNAGLIAGQETLQKCIAEKDKEIERLQNAYKQCAWERDAFLEDIKTTKMTDKELNEMIDWCRNKLANEKKKPTGLRLTSKELDGYEQAMKAVMSYLHSKKGGVQV